MVVERISGDVDDLPQALPDGALVAMSDTGGVVAYDRVVDEAGSAAPADDVGPTSRQVWIRDRVADTARSVVELPSAAPGISGDGCWVAYSVIGTDGTSATSTLTVVDRCAAAADLPLPIGLGVDTVTYPEGPVNASPPALSFDGAIVVWSTGREIRRYERRDASSDASTSEASTDASTSVSYELTHSFDTTVSATPEVVTGTDLDLSADGETVVFVAGPGAAPYEPSPSNVYAWSPAMDADAMEADVPQLLTPTEAGVASEGTSTTPSISADGTFVVFESSATDLAAAAGTEVVLPFVAGVDLDAGTAHVVLEDAARPALSADGLHLAYVRDEAIRVLVSGDTDTIDVAPDELVAARPTGRLVISQFGRWVMFPSEADLDPPGTGELSIWAADLASSDPSPVDTTTTTSTPPTTGPPSTVPSTTGPPSTVPTTTATVPPTTSSPTVIVPRFPNTGSWYPRVTLPRTYTRTSTTFGSSRQVVSRPSASVPLVVFDPTVIGVGRRTLPVAVTNTSTSTFAVVAASIEPIGPFSITADACTGTTLVPGGSCTVDVQFTPVDVGRVSAVLTVVVAGGSVATGTVEGEGVPNPTMDVVPGVAGAGQTVTVFGTGFPPGITVDFLQPGVAVPEPLVVDPDGTFAHVVVVLPNTPVGAVTLSVTGQPDVFDDVTTELLVSSRGASSDGAALRASSVAR